MNLKTTFVLLVLVVAGGVLFWIGPTLPPGITRGLQPAAALSSDAGTLKVLEEEITPDKLTRIEIQRPKAPPIILQKDAGGDWTMPGRWPTRTREVAQLVQLLTGELRSRFAPIPLKNDPPDLTPYGLDKPRVVVIVRAGGEDYRLAFGEPPPHAVEEANRFIRPTYLRLDKRPEVVRLVPGLLASLDRPADYYQQRRLFPVERVVRDSSSQEKVARVVARSITAEEQKKDGSKYTLRRQDSDWELTAPVRDRPDPDKLNAILTAVPDLWAEHFVEKGSKDLDDFGLKEPEQVLRVTRPSGETVELLIGKESPRRIERRVSRPSPPFGPPRPPIEDIVVDRFRYAKLRDNDQIFEIKTDKLKDIFVDLDTLRDPRVARFRTEDARRIEIQHDGQEIVLAKEKDRWRLKKPVDADAETSKVTDLLDELTRLQARGKDEILDNKDPKEFDLKPPKSTIKVTVEEEVREGDSKSKKARTIAVAVGKHDTEKKKLYLLVEGWPRINVVEDGLAKLVERQPVAYRGRRIFDFSRNELADLAVQRGDDRYQLKQEKGVWKLTVPVEADADSSKVGNLADDLSRLEAVEYVDDAPTPEKLEKEYGLDKPALTATLSFTDKDKPAQTLQIGKARGKKDEYFARLTAKDKPAVFVVRKQIRDDLDQGALAFRPTQLWQVQPEEVVTLKVQRQEQPEYRLERAGTAEKATWKLSGPFSATISDEQVKKMIDPLAPLRCERYEAHTATDKELEKYGLDKPYLRVALQTAKKGENDKQQPTPRVLLIGKPTKEGAESHFGKLASSPAVFVVGQPVVTGLDRSALDLLNRNLLALESAAITRIATRTADSQLTLQRQGDEWQVEAGENRFTADNQAMTQALNVWANLQAQRFAAYGDKVNWAEYGLDKPAVVVTVTLKPADEKAKPSQHTVALGKSLEGGERYARIDNGPGVVVLGSAASEHLGRTYLDFVDRTLLKLDPSALIGIQRKIEDQELELVKKEDGWHLVKPTEQRADAPLLENLVDQLARLRAVRVAAYPAKDLQPFGLDKPAAVVTLRFKEDDKPAERVLKLGKEADEKTGDRFVQVEGSSIVGVLAGTLAKRLLAEPLKFRDRGLARFTDADKAILERGGRKAVFTKVDGTWKLTEPVEAEAEQGDLDDLINAVARLRADELVAEKPSELKPYGLDKPEVRWRFLSGDKEVLSLLVGSHEKVKDGDGPRCYGKRGDGDLVVLFDPKLTAQLLGEYRSRTLWSSLDAAQVEALDYRYSRNPFTLEQEGNTWRVVGKPDVKISTAAVNETLAALAALKAERTVVDADADLKLYGLEPPQLVLEVRTRTGKRVLQIGQPEGETKRRYARVADGKRMDVFVISEADTARIVRELNAFTAGKAKE
jgi:hypothetical protein